MGTYDTRSALSVALSASHILHHFLHFSHPFVPAVIHRDLPKRLRTGPSAITVHTVGNRIRAAGYAWNDKSIKPELPSASQERRLKWCKEHKNISANSWLSRVQAVCDLKEYTRYPSDLAAKVKKYRCKFTYMKAGEKQKKGMTIPKDWFRKKDYMRAKKIKVFGCVMSCGKSWAVQKPCTNRFTTVVRNPTSLCNCGEESYKPYRSRAPTVPQLWERILQTVPQLS